jgi:two-component system cit operon sensor histidine kinase CitA
MIYSADLLISRVIVMKVSFQIKLFISLVAFFSVLFALLGGYYYVDVGRQLYQEMSARAKIQAEEIALIPTLRKEVEQKDIQASMTLCRK